MKTLRLRSMGEQPERAEVLRGQECRGHAPRSQYAGVVTLRQQPEKNGAAELARSSRSRQPEDRPGKHEKLRLLGFSYTSLKAFDIGKLRLTLLGGTVRRNDLPY